jgi:hypothetical protein
MQTAIGTQRPLLSALLLASFLGFACGVSHAETTGAAGQVGAIDFRTQFKDSLAEVPDPTTLSVKGTIYVPAYSRIYGAAGGASTTRRRPSRS